MQTCLSISRYKRVISVLLSALAVTIMVAYARDFGLYVGDGGEALGYISDSNRSYILEAPVQQ